LDNSSVTSNRCSKDIGCNLDLSARYAKSRALLERAERVIPLGSQTFSKSRMQFPVGIAPQFLDRGKGARVWDVDGNEYVDLVSALLPVVLGYCDPDVDAAVRAQMERGTVLSLSTELEVELAERLAQIIPCAEMVRFGKNGSDATSAAIRLARAFTGRDRIAICGYHGWQDWYIGSTVRNKGIPKAVCELSHRFVYNDIDSLQSLLAAHPGEFAAVIMEPMNLDLPRDGFLEKVRDLAHVHGALLIFDEVITGFRYALGGAQEYFGVTPDLAAFGKAMGNGLPIAAVVGRADIMLEMENIFYSGTFGGETLSIAAAIAVIDKMRKQPVIATLWSRGSEIADSVRGLIAQNGLADTIIVKGMPPWSLLDVRDHPNANTIAIKTALLRELLLNGVLSSASFNVSYALTDDDVAAVLSGYSAALRVIAEEIADKTLERSLEGKSIEAVFRVR
jgi:glutamate-1-semialdehyde 2,1-aminomutase/spore coat polysaccharide biosynthesis protein SpsF